MGNNINNITVRKHNHDGKKVLAAGGKRKARVSSNMPDLSDDPYFVKKAESARKLLDKFPPPNK
jgi:hypothetical protein